MNRKSLFPCAKAFSCFVLLAVSLAAAFAGVTGARAQGDRGAMPGEFDYYVLALSWSPAYCASHGRNDDSSGYNGSYRNYGGNNDRRGYGRSGSEEQCSGTRPFAFVLHGLWPQYERKGWPEMCETGGRPWVPEETIDGMMDIMPSRRLVIHEYKKHGTCSGLDPSQYFSAARKAYRSIHIPDEFRDLSKPLTVSPAEVSKAFLGANRQLTASMIEVVCSRRLLREVRICLTKDLSPRDCSQSEQRRRLCTYDTVTMPPVRGGGTGPRGGPSYERGDSL